MGMISEQWRCRACQGPFPPPWYKARGRQPSDVREKVAVSRVDARVGPYLSERVGAFYLGKQRSAVYVDCPNYVIAHVVGGAAAANVGLEFRLAVGGYSEQDLAEGGTRAFRRRV